jgi:FlaA1/EpsC-like NDP-sugar epimerase
MNYRLPIEQNFFYELTGKVPQETDLIFYGAGENGLQLLQNLYNTVIKCKSFSFVDSDPAKHNKTFAGFFPIKKPSDIKQYDKDNLVIFITTFGSTGGIAESIAKNLEQNFDLINGIHFYWYEYIVASLFQVCFGYPAYMPIFLPHSKHFVKEIK